MPINIRRERLSDGSFVHSVLIGSTVLDALDERHANELADTIAAAIRAHTNEHATVNYTGA